MARYNREFLVPYLQNVCALHLAESKLDRKISNLNASIRNNEWGISNPEPRKPWHYRVYTLGSILLIFGGIFTVGFMVLGIILYTYMCIVGESKFAIWIYIAMLACAALGAGMVFWGYDPILEAIKHNKKEQQRYQEDVKEYNRRMQLNSQNRKQIPQLQAEVRRWSAERNRIHNLLCDVYSVNVIPGRYRNIYTAVYLYDWFSTSQADDLDMALNMFVLEEIKDRLDRIIENQMDIILNQRMMLANQQRSLEQQQRHSNMMRSKLNQIAASNEERNIYLSMIESNTAATAYFAAADYIRKI